MTHDIIVTVPAPNQHSPVEKTSQKGLKTCDLTHQLTHISGSLLVAGMSVLASISKEFQKESFTPFLNLFHPFKTLCQRQAHNMAQTIGMAYPLRNDLLTIKSIAL